MLPKIFNFIPFSLLLITTVSTAEPIKIVHWGDAYLPLKKEQTVRYSYRSESPLFLQYQDVNRDGIYNDAIIWYPFSLQVPLNPLPPTAENNKNWYGYRIHRPSARFYGGLIARFAQVSHLTKRNSKGDMVPIFDGFQQASVQPEEGARPCSYSTKYPNNIGRSWTYEDYPWLKWADMTIMVVNAGGDCCPISEAFWKAKTAMVNFTTLFVWKKADFINRGQEIDKVYFDSESRFSVDLTRFVENVEEVRFVVQDGQQWWISEASLQKLGEEQSGQAGMEVQNYKFGLTVMLSPLNSRWSPYSPEETDEMLYQELQQANFNPKKASPEEIQKYQQNSDRLLSNLNQLEFNPEQAEFVETHFEDVQAVGIYAATRPFSREITQLVFDNFQVYAEGQVPAKPGLEFDSQGASNFTETRLTGGISVNCDPFEETVRECLCDRVNVVGNLEVAPSQVGKLADIFVYAVSKSSPESNETTYYMLDKQGGIQVWDQQLSNLVPFMENVTLQSQQSVEMYKGQFLLPGYLQVFFGYRLKENNQFVISQEAIEVNIQPINEDRMNEMPYCESPAVKVCP